MNAALDSPLEALAFNYLTYGFLTAVNNIWAWIAVVTAAVSFWRIRVLSSTSSSTTEPSSRSHDAAVSTTSALPRLAESAAVEPAKASSCVVLERQGSTKMKFSLYYKEETEEILRGDDGGGESGDCGGGSAAAVSLGFDAWRGDWEGVVALRMGDMGFYRWQDRTVLDGNVVRLWEGRRRIHAAAPVVYGGVAW